MSCTHITMLYFYSVLSGAYAESGHVIPYASPEAIPAGSHSLLVRHTWSDHSLPVTDVYCGSGGCRCRVATASLDQTCKVREEKKKHRPQYHWGLPVLSSIWITQCASGSGIKFCLECLKLRTKRTKKFWPHPLSSLMVMCVLLLSKKMIEYCSYHTWSSGDVKKDTKPPGLDVVWYVQLSWHEIFCECNRIFWK